MSDTETLESTIESLFSEISEELAEPINCGISACHAQLSKLQFVEQ